MTQEFVVGGAMTAFIGWIGYIHRKTDKMDEGSRKRGEILAEHGVKLDTLHAVLQEVRQDVKAIKNGKDE